MNRSETLQVLSYLKVAYPQAYNKMTKEDIQAMAKMWELQFKDFAYDVVMVAVNSFISSDTSGYFPVIGRIKELIYKISNPNEMTEQEAWNVIKKAISRSSWYSQEEFEKLPPNLQRLVGSPRQLQDWATMNSDELNTVVASNFMRSYKAKSNQDKEYQMLPNDVKTLIGSITQAKMIEENNDD